ncbi:hypothetical protein IWZ03DRAFT_200861 [Phyllosticta citriasiana]|uniref:Uncharacterized protein n=1 Tax=Phyllosticta citriasiana TaxID=595635 RepID=A0ABR1KR64_9PEZI
MYVCVYGSINQERRRLVSASDGRRNQMWRRGVCSFAFQSAVGSLGIWSQGWMLDPSHHLGLGLALAALLLVGGSWAWRHGTGQYRTGQDSTVHPPGSPTYGSRIVLGYSSSSSSASSSSSSSFPPRSPHSRIFAVHSPSHAKRHEQQQQPQHHGHPCITFSYHLHTSRPARLS